MRIFRLAALAAFLSTPALADNITIKDGNGTLITECSKTVTTVEHTCHYMEGSNAGAPTPLCVDSSGSLCPSPKAAITTNSSSAITAGNTFQTVASSSTSRKSLDFQNKCSVSGNCTTTVNRCWIFFGSGSATKSASVAVEAGQEYLRDQGTVPSDAVQITCEGTGDTFYFAVQ